MLSRFSCVRLFAIPWTVAHQAPLSKGFPRQTHWSELPFPPPRGLPDPGIEPTSPISPALARRFFISCVGKKVLNHWCHLGSAKGTLWLHGLELNEVIRVGANLIDRVGGFRSRGRNVFLPHAGHRLPLSKPARDKCLMFKPPVCPVLLWQPKLTNNRNS